MTRAKTCTVPSTGISISRVHWRNLNSCTDYVARCQTGLLVVEWRMELSFIYPPNGQQAWRHTSPRDGQLSGNTVEGHSPRTFVGCYQYRALLFPDRQVDMSTGE